MKLHKRLRTEFPGKIIPSLPRKNKSSSVSTLSSYVYDDNESVSSASVQELNNADENRNSRNLAPGDSLTPGDHHRGGRSRSRSIASSIISAGRSPGRSPGKTDKKGRDTVLFREEQRVSLRAFLRTLLQNKRIAESKAIGEFLTADPISLNDDELSDLDARKEMDTVRVEEQNRFYEVARQRAAELDVYMERFRRDIVEDSKFHFTSQHTWISELMVGFLLG